MHLFSFSPFSSKRIGVNSNIQKRLLLFLLGTRPVLFGSSLGATKRTNGELDLKLLPKKRYLVQSKSNILGADEISRLISNNLVKSCSANNL